MKLDEDDPATRELLNSPITFSESRPKPDEAARWRAKLAPRGDAEE